MNLSNLRLFQGEGVPEGIPRGGRKAKRGTSVGAPTVMAAPSPLSVRDPCGPALTDRDVPRTGHRRRQPGARACRWRWQLEVT